MIELISIHIAKTGGRSFYEILKHEYGSSLDPRTRRVDYFPDKDYSLSLLPGLPAHITVMHGHLFYEHIADIHQKYHPKLITWLRDPVERVISNYFFLMRAIREMPESHPQRHKSAYTLLDYMHNSIPNKMSRYLSGVSLEAFFFTGFQENFEEDLEKLAALLSWKKPLLKLHINSGPTGIEEEGFPTQRKGISEAMREQIRELNAKDMELYLQARKLRKERYGD